MRWLRRLLVALLVLVVVVALFGFFMVRRSFPDVDGEIAVAGLDGNVEVVRDVDGVPHIYASTSHDLFFAQGYAHAQDRFWQMDFWRHIGAGRLAEMFGEDQVETDMFLRSLGFTLLAEIELSEMPDEERAALEAYADGVNAYVQSRSPSQISLEYAILPLQNSDYEIEPWTAENSLTWAKVMSWDLSWNMLQEIDRATLSATLPLERIEQLYPDYPEGMPVIVPEDQSAGADSQTMVYSSDQLEVLASAAENARAVWDLTGGGFSGIGSNNWVVGGSHTESGLPVLANDPHLAIQMPSIWYLNTLHCTTIGPECPYRLAGFSFAGIPGVVIGHNEHIAWGVTNESVDTQDLFIEKINPDDPHQYELFGGWVDAEVRQETIVVAGGDDVEFDVVSTVHGPIISDTYWDEPPFQGSTLELPDPYAVSLAWQSLKPSTLVQAILGIDKATGYDEFREAARHWDIAAQNLVYADVEGNIAYQSTGEVPIRVGYDGSWPVPGWTEGYQFSDGLVPYEEMPRMFNPPRDYVATANNKVIAGDDPFLSVDSDYGYRAARIEELIGATDGYTPQSARDMQMDNRDGGAVDLVPYLLTVESDDLQVIQIQDLIRAWSTQEEPFQSDGDSSAAAAYQATWAHLLALTFHDELPEDSWPEGGSRWFQVVKLLLDAPDDPWWDDVATDVVENRDVILEQAMADAHAELEEKLGDNPPSWTWGELHRATFENQTFGQSGIGPIEWLFNRDAPPVLGGGADLVNAVGFYPPEGYVVDWVPSMRMVIDLSDFSESTAIHTTGQSGHAFHGHYADMIDDWSNGDQRPIRWTREQVDSAAAGTLLLTPAG